MNFLDQVKDIVTVERQLKYCHLVIISKVDLIDEKTLEEIKAKVREINDKADIIESVHGKYDYDFLSRDLIASQWIEGEDTTNTPENKPKTLSLTYDGELTKETLTKFLDAIKGDSYRINDSLSWRMAGIVTWSTGSSTINRPTRAAMPRNRYNIQNRRPNHQTHLQCLERDRRERDETEISGFVERVEA